MIRTREFAQMLESYGRERPTLPSSFRLRNGRHIQCRGNQYKFWEHFTGALDKGELSTYDFSIKDLFCEFVEDGRSIVETWNPQYGGHGGVNLVEAAVTTANFANITGQIVYSEILQRFADPIFLADRVCTTVPTQFSGEKIPGISDLGDVAQIVPENQPYPQAGVTEHWIETPVTTKRGMIIPVTKEAIFFDRTGVLMDRVRAVAEALAINKEKRVLDAVLGQTDMYKRNGATSATPTYGASSGSHDWVNLAASNGLVDWTDIENALLLFDGLTDPNTGEPIMVTPRQIIVPSALLMTARRIVNAAEILFGIHGDTSASTITRGMNPLNGMQLEILSSQYVKARTTSASTWFIGDFKQAFRYMQNWPITVVEAPANSEAEFTQDVVIRFKASERGAAAVYEPRAVVKNTA